MLTKKRESTDGIAINFFGAGLCGLALKEFFLWLLRNNWMKVATFLVQVTFHSSLSCLIQIPYCVWPNYVVVFVLCVPNKVKIVIPFVSKHYSNFNTKSISIATNSLLSNVKDNKLKKVSDKYKVIHALKQPKDLLYLLSKPEI